MSVPFTCGRVERRPALRVAAGAVDLEQQLPVGHVGAEPLPRLRPVERFLRRLDVGRAPRRPRPARRPSPSASPSGRRAPSARFASASFCAFIASFTALLGRGDVRRRCASRASSSAACGLVLRLLGCDLDRLDVGDEVVDRLLVLRAAAGDAPRLHRRAGPAVGDDVVDLLLAEAQQLGVQRRHVPHDLLQRVAARRRRGRTSSASMPPTPFGAVAVRALQRLRGVVTSASPRSRTASRRARSNRSLKYCSLSCCRSGSRSQ